MSNTDEIAYIPLTFGYTNYSRAGYAPKRIQFTNIPSVSNEPRGGLLGGVGLAVSATCSHIEEAVQYAMYVASPEIQKGVYLENGGQPGHRSAWTDASANELVGNFFQGTLKSMDLAFLRPRYAGYNLFQESTGEVLHEFYSGKLKKKDCLEQVNQLYQLHVVSRFDK